MQTRKTAPLFIALLLTLFLVSFAQAGSTDSFFPPNKDMRGIDWGGLGLNLNDKQISALVTAANSLYTDNNPRYVLLTDTLINMMRSKLPEERLELSASMASLMSDISSRESKYWQDVSNILLTK
ncbi:MAG: hypothetical protein HQK59_15520 [Deltaproteobacteria bacterium]|nr:hypothetical protein [Deltaproteobacteria bacterium]